MNYYQLAINGSSQNLLTYESIKEINLWQFVEVKLRFKLKWAYIVKKVSKPSFKTQSIQNISLYFLNTQQSKLCVFISQYYVSTLGQSVKLFTPHKNSSTHIISPIETNIILSSEQQKGFDFILKNKNTLLFGDTGSGKTEIYMKIFELMLSQQKRSLLLLPEISLTPQMQIRLEKHFGGAVVFWHSKQSAKKKAQILEKIYSGEASIIAGARSALFLPIENLGFIAVDEEHDDSYKSNQNPRYNARDMAIYYASLLNIPIVLGSATPALTSYHKFAHFRLKGGYFNKQKTYIYDNAIDTITTKIEQAIKDNYLKNAQAILFLPTRANFKYLVCNDCNHTYECPYCSIGMSLHFNEKKMQCHYCGFALAIPNKCPQCQQNNLQSHRIGTAEVYNWFNKKESKFRVALFDRDSVKTETALKKLLKSFNNKEIDLLIGTQMLSKGHDYHHINLAIILGIDHQLSHADYRAREKGLALSIQIAGRSGRKENSTIIVQTKNKYFFDQYIEDYEQFIQDELPFRKDLYPPFRKLARVIFSHTNENIAQEEMNKSLFELQNFEHIDIIGYGASAIQKIANKYRYTILVRSESSKFLLNALHKVKSQFNQIDVDPIDFN